MHGDVLCTGDASYQRLRRILRNPITLFLLRHLVFSFRDFNCFLPQLPRLLLRLLRPANV